VDRALILTCPIFPSVLFFLKCPIKTVPRLKATRFNQKVGDRL